MHHVVGIVSNKCKLNTLLAKLELRTDHHHRHHLMMINSTDQSRLFTQQSTRQHGVRRIIKLTGLISFYYCR